MERAQGGVPYRILDLETKTRRKTHLAKCTQETSMSWMLCECYLNKFSRDFPLFVLDGLNCKNDTNMVGKTQTHVDRNTKQAWDVNVTAQST